MLTALSIVFVFGLMVMVHELGHYMVAKWLGIKILEFSFGFGPKIVGYQGKDTLYAWRLIPLGGFVRLHGMDPETNDNGVATIASPNDEQSFMNKRVWQRIAVIVAGPLMNFFLAIVIFVAVFAYMGIPTPVNQIGSLIKDKPAEKAGLLVGDRIIAIDNVPTKDWTLLTETIHAKPNQTLVLTIDRANHQENIKLTTEKDPQTGNGMIGIAPPPEIIYEKASLPQSVRLGLKQTYDFTKFILVSLIQMITRKIPADVGGPVAIAQAIGEGAQGGFANLLGLTAVLSIQLGLINLFPIPALDGSRIIFLLVEGLRRKPLAPEKENLIHLAGFVLLLMLMLAITYHDIVRLFTKVG